MTGADVVRHIQDYPVLERPRIAVLSRAALLGVALLSSADGLMAQRVARGDSELAVVWSEAAPGVWKAVLGTPESVSLLGTAGGHPVVARLATMQTVSFPIARDAIAATRTDPMRIVAPFARV